MESVHILNPLDSTLGIESLFLKHDTHPFFAAGSLRQGAFFQQSLEGSISTYRLIFWDVD